MYKTLNNHIAKHVIENITGHPKFTFISLYSFHHEKYFTDEAYNRLYNITKRLLYEFHSKEDLELAIKDCPLVVQQFLRTYKKQNHDTNTIES